jgi:hypothetical protein
MANTVTITGTVTDAVGATGSYSVVVTLDSVTANASVTPATAPAGTTRTLTVTATSSTGAALTFPTPVVSGLTFTSVGSQPAGQAQWTFVY